MAAKIKIFMCAHREVSLIPPLTLAIQGGAAVNAPIKGVASAIDVCVARAAKFGSPAPDPTKTAS